MITPPAVTTGPRESSSAWKYQTGIELRCQSSLPPTGTLGLPLVRRLAAAGHAVAGLTRSSAKRRILESAGAGVALADALDGYSLRTAVRAAAPTHVVNLLTPEALVRGFRTRRLLLPGGPSGVASWIYIDDAVTAAVAALERPAPGAVYYVVDDEPMPLETAISLAACLLQLAKPRRAPAWPLG
jgi:nucleoside-diphosphate-sugar epimerase